MMKRTGRLSIIGILGFVIGTAYGAPQLSQATGDVSPGQLLEVDGSGFGANGPNILLFEDFESSSPGSSVGVDDPYIGRWSGLNDNPVIANGGRSGVGSMLAYNGDRQRQAKLMLGSKQREIFISYWVRVPPGTRFPGQTSGTSQFSSDSSWKFVWLMDTDDGDLANDGLYDFCIPTHTGDGRFQLAGNTFKATDRYISNGWWSWNNWMHVSMWIRDPTQKSPGGVFEVSSADRSTYREDFGSPTSDIAYSRQTFDVLKIPGWIRTGGGSNVQPLYDDIYVSTGPGAAARVEIANSSNYNNATKVELLLVESWSDNAIDARLPRKADVSGESWYLFVTDSNGNRSSGLEVCATCETQRPNPPRLTSVQ